MYIVNRTDYLSSKDGHRLRDIRRVTLIFYECLHRQLSSQPAPVSPEHPSGLQSICPTHPQLPSASSAGRPGHPRATGGTRVSIHMERDKNSLPAAFITRLCIICAINIS